MLVRPLPSYGCLSCGFRCFSSSMIQLHWRHWHYAFIAPAPTFSTTIATATTLLPSLPPPPQAIVKFPEMSQLAVSSLQPEVVNTMRSLESLVRPSVIVKSTKLLDPCPTPVVIRPAIKVKGKSDSNPRHWLVKKIHFTT